MKTAAIFMAIIIFNIFLFYLVKSILSKNKKYSPIGVYACLSIIATFVFIKSMVMQITDSEFLALLLTAVIWYVLSGLAIFPCRWACRKIKHSSAK